MSKDVKKKKKGKKKVVIIILLLLIIALVGVGAFYYIKKHPEKTETKETKKTNYEDEIKGYGYTLEKRDTDLFREKFKELKKVLSKKPVDFKKYAELLSELYIIDLYTIDNKDSTYDIGGSEYIYPDALENYETKVKDTLYKYVKTNDDGKRDQELPEVSEISAKDIEESTFKLKETEYPSYTVSLKFSYKEGLGYDTKAIVILIKKDDKLYIVQQGDDEESES